MDIQKSINDYNNDIPKLKTIKSMFDKNVNKYARCDGFTTLDYRWNCDCKMCTLFLTHMKDIRIVNRHLCMFQLYCEKLLYKVNKIDDYKYVIQRMNSCIELTKHNNSIIGNRTYMNSTYETDLLYRYSSDGKIELVKYLCEEDRSKYILDQCHRHACKAGHIDIVKFLMSKGSKYDTTCFITACIQGHIDLVKYYTRSVHFFLATSYTNSIHTITNGLREACGYDHFDIVQYLIENFPAASSEKCLFEACRFNRIQIIKYLLERGTKYDSVSKVWKRKIKKSITRYHNQVYVVLDDYIYKVLCDVVIEYI